MFQVPIFCPSCETKLILTATEIDLICPNSQSCPAQILGKLSYFCSRNIANITGLSQKILVKLIKNFQVQNLADLYDLPFEKIKALEGFGELSATNLTKSIEKSRTISDYKFLAGLGIESIGPENAKLICELIFSEIEQNPENKTEEI